MAEKCEPISKFLQTRATPQELCTRSISGTVYSTTLVVHPSESETETCECSYVQSSAKSVGTIEPASHCGVSNSICETVENLQIKGVTLFDQSTMDPNVRNLNAITTTTGSLTQTTPSVIQSRGSIPYLSTQATTITSTQTAMAVCADGDSIKQTSGSYENSLQQSYDPKGILGKMGTQMMAEYQQYADNARLYAGQTALVQPVVYSNSGNLSDFTKLSTSITGVHRNLLQASTKQIEMDAKMEGLEFEQEQDHSDLLECQNTVHLLEDKIKLMGDIMVKHDDELCNLRRKLKGQENKHIKFCVKISGLATEEETELTEQVKNFLKNQVKIKQPINIAKVSKMKMGNPPMLVVQLTSLQDKKTIFEHVKNLKGVKNANGKAYGIFNMLTDEAMEKDIRKCQVLKTNYALPIAQRHKVNLKKGQLIVNNAVYRLMYDQLTTKDLLEMGSDDWIQSKEVNAASSKVIAESGSTFQAFAIKVHSMADIRRCYKHFKN